MFSNAAGFVLTGGKSSRMGRDKALLELGGQPLAVRIAERLRPVVGEVALISNLGRHGQLGLRVFADRVAGRGPLGGIVTALENTRCDWNLIVACDLPFLDTGFLRVLLERAVMDSEADAVVPKTADGWQPLCAAYHRRCLPILEIFLASDNPKVARTFEYLNVRIMAPDELEKFAFPARLFENMNTPEDYREAGRLLKGTAG